MSSSEIILFYVPLSQEIFHQISNDKHGIQKLWQFYTSIGKKVKFVSSFSSFDPHGDKLFQLNKMNEADHIQENLFQTFKDLKLTHWFTFYQSYKAPDLLGPDLCKKLSIPYTLIEASLDPKQEKGKWSVYYPHLLKALNQAKSIVSINPKDSALLNGLGFLSKNKLISTSLTSYFAKSLTKAESRSILYRKHHLNADLPWFLVITPSQEYKSLEIYKYLREVLLFLKNDSFECLVLNANPLQGKVKALLGPFHQIHFISDMMASHLTLYYKAADMLCCPGMFQSWGNICLMTETIGLKIVIDETSCNLQSSQNKKNIFPVKSVKNFAELIQKEIENAYPKRIISSFSH